jgi:hypothetical protein
MSLRFDEKGKYFTDYITKESVPVVIQTITHHIRGFIYVQEDERLSDELNKNEQFLPVTQAVILDLTGNKLFETPFLAINRHQVIWLYPEETPPAEDVYAVDALLMGQDPLVSSELYIVGADEVEQTQSLPAAPEETLPAADASELPYPKPEERD